MSGSTREHPRCPVTLEEPLENVSMSPSAPEIIAEIKRAAIRFVVALPDRVSSEHLLKPILTDPEFHVVQVCKEDEGISILSGLYATGHRGLLLLQQTGL